MTDSQSIEQLLEQLENSPETVEFTQVIAVIEAHYDYQPSLFINGLEGLNNKGPVSNEAGTNEGSCKLFSFGLINQLSAEEMLACFGGYYRNDVLQHPEGTDHANIRTFMVSGWDGIKFEQPALTPKG